jgi:hypothetical protein
LRYGGLVLEPRCIELVDYPGSPVKPRKPSFDAAGLRVLEELVDSTWAIFEARYPFRNLERDEHLQEELRRKLFLLAESRGLTDLDQIQTSALQAISLE